MIQESEIVMLILGLGVLVFILGNLPQLKRIPYSRLLLSGFYTLLVGWVMTVLEGFIWSVLLNYLEHMCYAIASLLLAVWCWRVFGTKEEAR